MELLDPAAAARIILDGGVVAAPTEAVYGLSCDPWNEAAVERLVALKQRAMGKGLILVAGGLYQFTSLVQHLDRDQQDTLASRWPGPYTWLVPTPPGLPEWITGGQATLALRVTAHPVMAELCRQAGKPLTSTSANLSGQPPAITPAEVADTFPDIDGIVAGDLGGATKPTEIRNLETGEIVRSGT
ncbi:MAG: Sua5/YciO/YrdC/YwlC family protein [Gammaproteobacteria bacterium]|nr:Sua5/YciO/YrdC/YwlC family protein [Gammaproteobacteria bacterium]